MDGSSATKLGDREGELHFGGEKKVVGKIGEGHRIYAHDTDGLKYQCECGALFKTRKEFLPHFAETLLGGKVYTPRYIPNSVDIPEPPKVEEKKE
jgi:hypothetical protein